MSGQHQKIPLPQVPIAEATLFRVQTAPGMFAYRQAGAMNLLSFPDLGGGDLTEAQRREALDAQVGLRCPLLSLALFYSVVALEDLIRDTGDRLAKVLSSTSEFPNIGLIATKVKAPQPSDPSVRPDKETLSYLKPSVVNDTYRQVMGVEVIDAQHEARISDLALLRHTVAHHGGMVRAIDVQRFQYYDVQANHLINPPREFVLETAQFIYSTGSEYIKRVSTAVFRAAVPPLRPIDPKRPPQKLIELIECFDYLGKLAESELPPPSQEWYAEGRPYDEIMEKHQRLLDQRKERVRQRLIARCVDEILSQY